MAFKNIAQPGAKRPILDDEGALLVSLAEKHVTLMCIWAAMREAGYFRDRETYKEYLLRYDRRFQYLRGNAIRPEEDAIIRDCASKGYALPRIAGALAEQGFRRKTDTIGGYMRANNISKAVICELDEQMKRFGAAWNHAHPDKLYQDHRSARPCLTTRITAPSATDRMTTGGVAVYG